jgi:hypothetical protein
LLSQQKYLDGTTVAPAPRKICVLPRGTLRSKAVILFGFFRSGGKDTELEKGCQPV